MADMTFKVNLLPNSTTKEYSLGSSQKRWNIYGDLTGYSSNAISWDSTNKKLQQTVSSSGAADVLSFAAGDGINLTAAASSLTIAAKTALKSADTSTGSNYYMLFSDITDNSGKLYKSDFMKITLPVPNDILQNSLMIRIGENNGVNTHFIMYDADGKCAFRLNANSNVASLSIGQSGGSIDGNNYKLGELRLWGTFQGYNLLGQSNSAQAPDVNYYFTKNETTQNQATRYFAYTTDNSASIGDSGMPVYATSNGEITSCTKSDLQANIFVISDTAPADTSVIWLKPVSSTS